jgi:hypothetical protein
MDGRDRQILPEEGRSPRRSRALSAQSREHRISGQHGVETSYYGSSGTFLPVKGS